MSTGRRWEAALDNLQRRVSLIAEAGKVADLIRETISPTDEEARMYLEAAVAFLQRLEGRTSSMYLTAALHFEKRKILKNIDTNTHH